MGMASSGLGEINSYNFIKRMKMELSASSGTSVFMVAVGAIVGVILHTIQFLRDGSLDLLMHALPIVVFSVPGVVIGAQFGVLLAQKIKNPIRVERLIGSIFSFSLCDACYDSNLAPPKALMI